MVHPINDMLRWKKEGQHLIPENFVVFHELMQKAEDLVKQRNYSAAAVYCQIAANYAQLNHCGFFVSSQLEALLLQIGEGIEWPQSSNLKAATDFPKLPLKILHVSTHISAIGGIPRLMWRWIRQDASNCHSVALTRQSPSEVPIDLERVVSNSGGKVLILNDKVGGIIERAKRLREASRDADIVVLHTWEYDVVPTIAFANQAQSPAIIYTNHGDHWFWVGVSISNVIANLRESGRRLSQNRRGINSTCNLVLPTILEPVQRSLSRSEAKLKLGLEADNILLLSIARSVKYKTVDGISFADAHVELLNRHSKAILIVIGPAGHCEDWLSAIEKTNARIKVFAETKDTAIFYQAADIYVDSFPFSSITSILEAGCYGVPSVTRYPYDDTDCEILGADMPGLDDNLIRVSSLSEYKSALSNLIKDKEFRIAKGQATRNKIEAIHLGESWQKTLNTVYSISLATPRLNQNLDRFSDMMLGSPDEFLPSVNYTHITTVAHWHLSLMPFFQRVSLWLNLSFKYGLKRNPLNSLLPERVRSEYYRFRNKVFKS